MIHIPPPETEVRPGREVLVEFEGQAVELRGTVRWLRREGNTVVAHVRNAAGLEADVCWHLASMVRRRPARPLEPDIDSTVHLGCEMCGAFMRAHCDAGDCMKLTCSRDGCGWTYDTSSDTWEPGAE